MDELKDKIQKKLEWEKNPSKHEMTWYNAVEYTKSLGDGWRLPTINELKEAYKNNDKEFKCITYWSNYSYLPNDNFAYAYLIEIGFIINILKVFKHNVHCVKEIE